MYDKYRRKINVCKIQILQKNELMKTCNEQRF